MADFSKCIIKTLQYEGVSSSSDGYVDHPNDNGGATKYGISYAFIKGANNIDFFDMNGDNIIDKRDIKNLTFEKAVDIYKKYFWDVFDLDDLDDNKKAFLFFDAAVNHGVRGATKLVQRSLNYCGYSLKVDGIYGKKSKNALIEVSTEDFVENFQKCRTALYKSIVKGNPTQRVFLNGWLNRIKWTERDLENV